MTIIIYKKLNDVFANAATATFTPYTKREGWWQMTAKTVEINQALATKAVQNGMMFPEDLAEPSPDELYICYGNEERDNQSFMLLSNVMEKAAAIDAGTNTGEKDIALITAIHKASIVIPQALRMV